MNLSNIILSERSQTQMNAYYVSFYLFEYLARTDRIIVTNGISVVAMGGVKWTGKCYKETL